MKETNEFLLEGLYEDGQKRKKEKEEEKEENEQEGPFIHESDVLQKDEVRKKTKTIRIPKSKLNFDDKKKINLSQINPTNEIYDTNENVLEFVNNEQELANEDSGNHYFNIEEMLYLEDPFMRVSRASRPIGINNTFQRISAEGVKTTKTKKRKNDFFLKKCQNLFKKKKIH